MRNPDPIDEDNPCYRFVAVGCMHSLHWFRHADGFARRTAVQHVWAKIYAIGPNDGPRIGIYLNLTEEMDILQRVKYAAATDDAISEVQLRYCAIGETQLESILPKVPDVFDPRKHDLPVYSRGSILSIGWLFRNRCQFRISSR